MDSLHRYSPEGGPLTRYSRSLTSSRGVYRLPDDFDYDDVDTSTFGNNSPWWSADNSFNRGSGTSGPANREQRRAKAREKKRKGRHRGPRRY